MEKRNNITNFLAKWANGTLADHEIASFEKTEECKHYKSILKGTDLLELPGFDKEYLLKKTQDKIIHVKKKSTVFSLWTYGAVAAIAILITYVFSFKNTVEYNTSTGQQLAISLPDSSQVLLNATSTLTHKKRAWKNNRRLNLTGEAFFKVAKGSTFKVVTPQGDVSVIGTQFTVNARKNTFEVSCYKGSVKVEKAPFSKTIHQGQAIRFLDNSFEKWNISENSPSWTKKLSSFSNTPLNQVITALENQYNISIDSKKVNTKIRYTGGFVHSNLEKALQTVFEPLKIKFTFVDKNNIVLVDR